MEANKKELKLEDTELRLGLPGSDSHEKQLKPRNATKNNKRVFADINEENGSVISQDQEVAPMAKAQVIGWPPIRSYRKNTFQAKKTEVEEGGSGMYVKISMDGAPYLRKIDLRLYGGYAQFLKAVQDLFKLKVGSGHVPTYEDRDGDWMLVGDVPWEMFTTSCKRLRIMKGSDANGLGRMP